MHPFDEYVLRQSSEGVRAEQVFLPDVKIEHAETGCVTASTGDLSFVLFDAKDLLRLSATRGGQRDILGTLSERLLSLVMEAFLKENAAGAEYGIVRESKRHSGKGYVARYNDEYLLRFKERTTLVLLAKDPDAKAGEIFHQEKFGLMATEIDGLGYMHGDGPQLVIGEASYKNVGRLELNSWDKDHYGTVIERIVRPLKSLFPDHTINYFVMAKEHQLFRNGDARQQPRTIATTLAEHDLRTIIAPVPVTDPSLNRLAERLARNLPLVRAVIASID